MENKKTAESPEVSKAEEKAQKSAAPPEGASIAKKENKADDAQKARTEETSVSQSEKAEGEKPKEKSDGKKPKDTTEGEKQKGKDAESVKSDPATTEKAEKTDEKKEEKSSGKSEVTPEKGDAGEKETQTAGKTENKSEETKAEAKAAEETKDGKSGGTAETTTDNSTKAQEETKSGNGGKDAAAEGAAADKTEPEKPKDAPAEAPTEKSADAEKTEEKPEKPNIVLSALGIILCVILVPILALNIVLIVQGFTQDASVMPNIAGKFPLMVQSGSMSPTIEVGDLIIVNAPEKGQTFGVDDVVTFWDGAPGGALVTHRIVEITTDDNGKTAYRTKGDANSAQDGTLVYAEDIVGTYVMRIPFLGDVAMFMQTIPGLIVCVILPLALFIVYDVIRRRKLSKSEQEETAALMEELERLRAEQKKS